MSELPLKSAGQPASDRSPAKAFDIESPTGIRARLLNQGAAILSLQVPTSSGLMEVTLGTSCADADRDNPAYLGATVGRYANRIEDALLRLDGQVHELTPTPGQRGHCLHGGARGFSHRHWETLAAEPGRSVRFGLVSPAGDQGFPGTVTSSVNYSMRDDRTLQVLYTATCDAPTVVSLANHAYFNLDGDGSTVTDHQLSVNADHYTPLKSNLIPSGEIRGVEGTVLDLRTPLRIGDLGPEADRQLALTEGLDHNFALNRTGDQPSLAAVLFSPKSGIRMELYTTLPGLQVYGGQHLEAPLQPRAGLCLEAQHFPNAPNQPGFPSAILRPGEQYRHTCLYRFSLD